MIFLFKKVIFKHYCGPFRSSHRRCSVRKGVLRNVAKFTEKHLCQSLFFNKVAGLRPATLLKKRLWHRCFPVNFAKILRAPFLQNTWTAASCHCSQILIILRGLCPCFDHSQGDLKWDSCFHICLNSEFSWAQKLATFRLFKSLSHTVVTYHMTWIQLHCSCVESELTPRR